MVAQGIWDSVTIALASDFGRGIRGNGLGTDHAWGGHYFMAGGSVAGGKIHGDYWADMSFSNANTLNVGHGRMIPTIPWDAQWHAIAQWMDVLPEAMSVALPNKDVFAAGTTPSGGPQLLQRAEVFSN